MGGRGLLRAAFSQERAAVLDMYFDEIKVEQVNVDEGWKRINKLPKLNGNR